MNSERKAFEETIKKISGGDIKNQINEKNGEYFYGVMQLMWVVWQASAQRQGYKLVPVEPSYKQLDAIKNSCVDIQKADLSDLEAHRLYRDAIGVINE